MRIYFIDEAKIFENNLTIFLYTSDFVLFLRINIRGFANEVRNI
jgi:hypothetical protein